MSALVGRDVGREGFVRSRPRRLLVPIALLVAGAIAAFGVRAGASYGTGWWAAQHAPPPAATSHMPASPAIEARWGVRFTIVQLLADNGLVELRYQVLDVDKANRLHADSQTLADIPSFRVEGSGGVVKANSLLFHIHHEWDQGSNGRSYSIVYGNAGGVMHANDRVTVVMPDGLELRHVPVYG